MNTKQSEMYFTKEDIEKRRQKLSEKWDQILKDNEAVLVYSGSLIQKPGGLDHVYPFLPHPSYYWLTARRREDEVVCYNKNTGWIEFQKELTKEQSFWEGERNDLLASQSGESANELQTYLNAQNFTSIYKLGQTCDYKPQGKAFELKTLLDQTRRIKDESEIKLIKQIAEIAATGYKKIEEILTPGITEREIQIAYEAEIFRNGAHKVPYDTIVGSGSNAAIMHASPSQKIIREQELVLIDAGADVYDYCVDITRTYNSSGEMDSRQIALYQLVQNVFETCTALTKAAVFWRDVHCKAAIMFTEGLHNLGILKGSLDDLIEKEVIYLFFPHGLGHLVGLRVRDTGQEENLEPKRYFGARLRVDVKLQEGHVITMEPGLYFIKTLLEDSESRNKHKEDINWQELEKWKNTGGVRIEDNLLITASANENLTLGIPKNVI